jgi:RHS repeat-associated protein
VSVTTGASTRSQTFLPWGAPRSGSVSATKRNYTGQYRDDTGLLYYHARYYDPVLGRFISPDTLVPDPTDPQDLNRYTYAKNNPMRYTDPTGHSVQPPPCLICDVEFANIAEWSEPAIALAEVGCLVVGCHIDRAQGVVRGPTYEEWLEGQAAGLMPAGVVAKGPGTALRQGSRVIRGIDTVVNGQRVRHIGSVLDIKAKKYLRKEAKNIYDKVYPGRRLIEQLEVHHRIPLEYAHLFPDADPNRLSNLIGLERETHDQIEGVWHQFRKALNGRTPTAAEVQRLAANIDVEYSRFYR